MKRCPHCRQSYSDETLIYCVEDGSVLVGDSSDIHSTAPPPAESATVMLHTTGLPGQDPKPFQVHTNYQNDTTNAVES